MKNNILSLGGSCNTATILKLLNINNIHYFFDFIWNESAGLSAVTEIIKNDFKHFDDIANYSKELVSLNNRSTRLYHINKHHPSFVFFHQDASDPKIIESIKRKIKRTMDVFQNQNKKYFIYYRKPIHDNKQQHTFTDWKESDTTVDVLAQESLEFCDMYKQKYDDNFCLISLINYDYGVSESVITKDLNALRVNENENLKFDYIYKKTGKPEDGNLQSFMRILTKHNIHKINNT